MKNTVMGLTLFALFVMQTGCAHGPYYCHRPWRPLVPCEPCGPCEPACEPCLDCGAYYGCECGVPAPCVEPCVETCVETCVEPCPVACDPMPCCAPHPCGPCCTGTCAVSCEHCHGPITWLFRALTHGCYYGPSCGEAYWGDWISDPPECYDPCGLHGDYIGHGPGAYYLYHPKAQAPRGYVQAPASQRYAAAHELATSDCRECTAAARPNSKGWVTSTPARERMVGRPKVVSDRAVTPAVAGRAAGYQTTAGRAAVNRTR